MEFAPHTSTDVAQMLEQIGVARIEDLFTVIPEGLRVSELLAIPAGKSEAEILHDMGLIAAQNRSADDLVCFLGAGAYDHHVPSMVWALLSRGELATSYTPYQPELSQGVLQALFEYQTMVCELTGMDISNAGLYDGGSAHSEAVNLAIGATGRRDFAVADSVNPLYREVMVTQGAGLGVGSRPVAWGSDGRVDLDALRAAAEGAAGIIVQHPNVFGVLEDIPSIAQIAADAGAKLIVHYDLLASGITASPGSLGADVVVAEGQALGNHLNFGGPYAGVIACRIGDVRRLPGRLAGETVDQAGRRAFVLTLQAREQHIRREKATSNICTNQTLNTLAVAVALSWYGPMGLQTLGENCLAKARYCRDRLVEVAGATPLFDGPIFKEFAVRLSAPAAAVLDAVAEDGFLGGLALARFYPDMDDALLVAVTEKRSRDEIDAFANAVARACKEVA